MAHVLGSTLRLRFMTWRETGVQWPVGEQRSTGPPAAEFTAGWFRSTHIEETISQLSRRDLIKCVEHIPPPLMQAAAVGPVVLVCNSPRKKGNGSHLRNSASPPGLHPGITWWRLEKHPLGI